MTRLLYSIALALAVHGLIFCFGGEWLKNRPYREVMPTPFTISLTYLPPADTKSLEVPEKITGNMPENQSGKTDIFEHPVSRPEIPDAMTRTDIPTVPGVMKANAVTDSVLSSVDIGYKERDPKNGLEDLNQDYDSTAGVMLPGSQIVKEAVPLYKENPAPGYPMQAKRRGYEGTVILEVLVTKEGKAGKVSVFQSSRFSLLDEAAVSSVKKWRFEPGKRGDEKVDMPVKIPIRFHIEAN